MLSLHNADEEIKAVVKWVSIIIGTFLLVILLFNLGKGIKEIISPTPPPPPTVSFGKLPKINFPPNKTTTVISYTLDTLTGRLPAFPDRVSVYKIIPASPSLIALQTARERVSRAGFKLKETPVSDVVYSWEDAEGRKLIYNIVSKDFSLSSDFYNDTEILLANKLPNESESKSFAQNFISALTDFPQDIDTSKTKTSLFSIKDSTLIPATSLSTTQVIKVDFFQKDVDSFPIVYSNSLESPINAIVGSGRIEAKIVSSNFFHQSTSNDSATYPIITADEAFSQLKKGNAYIASYTSGEDMLIKNVSLSYYMEDKKQNYLTPVVVFEGNNGFIAYVEAIKSDWLE